MIPTLTAPDGGRQLSSRPLLVFFESGLRRRELGDPARVREVADSRRAEAATFLPTVSPRTTTSYQNQSKGCLIQRSNQTPSESCAGGCRR